MLYKNDIMNLALIPIVEKIGFASHTKPTAEAIQESTSFMIDNM